MYEFIRVYLLAEIVPLPKYFFSICFIRSIQYFNCYYIADVIGLYYF